MGAEVMVAITWTDDPNAVIISSTGEDGNVYYWWQQEGTTGWMKQLVGAPVFVSGQFNAYSEPTMAWTGDAVIIAAADSFGNLDYWWQAKHKLDWNVQHVAAAASDGGIVYTKPAIAWAGDSVALVAADTAGSLTYWWQAKNTTPWNRQIIDTAHQPAITGAPNNSASIAAVDPEGLRYWWRITDQQFSNPSTVSSLQQGTYSQPAIAWGDGTAVIAAVDNAGSLHYWWGNAEIWNPQVVAIMIGGFGYSQPSIAWADGAVVITAVDSAGNLDYWWQPEGSSGWNQQQVANASKDRVKYGSPAIAWTGGAVVIAAKSYNTRGYLRAINYWWQAQGASVWNPQTVATYEPLT
jgi:LRR adjacent